MPDHLTSEKVAELRRLHEAATEAPWAWEPTGDKDNSWGLGLVEDDAGNLIAGYAEPGANEVIEPVCESIDGRHADAQLIAETRNALPALLDLIDAQAAVLRDLVDPDGCSFDHHGYCQAHGWLTEGVCPQRRAKDLLADRESAPPECDRCRVPMTHHVISDLWECDCGAQAEGAEG